MSATERSCILTGIGGQGIQLAGQVMARAALSDGLHAQLFQNYAGLMRGGQTEASVVFDRSAVRAPSVLGSTWSAIVMHHEYWDQVRARIEPGGVVILNTSVVPAALAAGLDATVVEVPATDLAVDLGDILLASMVLLGVHSAVTSMLSVESLEEGLQAALPAYRAERAVAGFAAIEHGHRLEGLPRVDAWDAGVPA